MKIGINTTPCGYCLREYSMLSFCDSVRLGARTERWLVTELVRQGGDRGVDHRRTALLVELGDDDLARGRNRDVDSYRTDFGKRLGFLLRDALLRQAPSPF